MKQLTDTGLTRGIYSLVHLIEDHPVGVDLGVSLWVQHHGLIGPEVGQGDLGVLRAVVDDVNDAVFVKVPFARVSNSVHFKKKQHTVSVLRRLAAQSHARTHPGRDTNCPSPFGPS